MFAVFERVYACRDALMTFSVAVHFMIRLYDNVIWEAFMTRLETRTKESCIYASSKALCLVAQVVV